MRDQSVGPPARDAWSTGSGDGYLYHFDRNTNPRPNPALARFQLPGEAREYGDPENLRLRIALARWWGVETENVVVGNGSDEVIDLILRAFVRAGDRVLYPTPTFEMYGFLARLRGAEVLEIPMAPPFVLDPEAVVEGAARVTFVASPNNPTGLATPPEVLEGLAANLPGVLVVDGAYAEYSGEEHWRTLGHHGNVVVLGTLSKAHGMAGLRVGYGLAHPDVAAALRRVRGPYSLNVVGEAAACEALASRSFVQSSVALVDTERPRLAAALARLGFHVFPSRANFLLCRPPVAAPTLAARLASRGLGVRSFPGDPAVGDCLRISVGLPAQDDVLLEALGEALGAMA